MTLKEMLEEEIWKIAPNEDDSSQSKQESSEARSRSPLHLCQSVPKNTLWTMNSEIIEELGTNSVNELGTVFKSATG